MSHNGEARPTTILRHDIDINTTGQTAPHSIRVVGFAVIEEFSDEVSHLFHFFILRRIDYI